MKETNLMRAEVWRNESDPAREYDHHDAVRERNDGHDKIGMVTSDLKTGGIK